MSLQFEPKCYVMHYYEQPTPGQFDVVSLGLGTDQQITYDADAAGDSIFTIEEAKVAISHPHYFLWNDAEGTYESYDDLGDVLDSCRALLKQGAYKSFVYWNSVVAGTELGTLTQTFMWFE